MSSIDLAWTVFCFVKEDALDADPSSRPRGSVGIAALLRR